GSRVPDPQPVLERANFAGARGEGEYSANALAQGLKHAPSPGIVLGTPLAVSAEEARPSMIAHALAERLPAVLESSIHEPGADRPAYALFSRGRLALKGDQAPGDFCGQLQDVPQPLSAPFPGFLLGSLREDAQRPVANLEPPRRLAAEKAREIQRL